jgi:hypothetical protein
MSLSTSSWYRRRKQSCRAARITNSASSGKPRIRRTCSKLFWGSMYLKAPCLTLLIGPPKVIDLHMYKKVQVSLATKIKGRSRLADRMSQHQRTISTKTRMMCRNLPNCRMKSRLCRRRSTLLWRSTPRMVTKIKFTNGRHQMTVSPVRQVENTATSASSWFLLFSLF